MGRNVAMFLEDVELRNVSTPHIFEGIIQFEKAVDDQLTHPWTSSNDGETSLHRGAEGDHLNSIQSAISSFGKLVWKTTNKELPAPVFLATEFSYANAPREDTEGLEIAIIKGLESLMHLHARSPTAEPLQRWAHIAVAANFVQTQPVNIWEWTEYGPQPEAAVGTLPTSRRDESCGAGPDEDLPKQHHPADPLDHQKVPIDHKTCSLGLIIEQCYGVPEDYVEDEDRPGYKRAFRDWEIFLASFILDKQSSESFRSRLSLAQNSSARLLIEWWKGDIGLEMRTPQALAALEAASRTGHLDGHAFQVFGISPLAIADGRRNHYLQRLIFDCSGPPYHTFMFRLFQMEFLHCHHFGALAKKALTDARQKAAKLAACQRVSLSCYKSLLSVVDTLSGAERRGAIYDGKKADARANQTVIVNKNKSLSMPHDQMNNSMKAPEHGAQEDLTPESLYARNKCLSLDEIERLKRATYPGSVSTVGASLTPCDWLERTGSSKDFPYYLWDLEERRTVLAGKLSGAIEYTAVSHTWGRYKHHNYTEFPPVHFEGMKEWCIPQNSKFEVEHLPDILASGPFDTRYVWFDLLCIPQEPTDERLQIISRQEIGRQASIFRCAKSAVAWFNDIDDWQGMNAAIRRLSICFLEEGNENGVLQPILDQLALDHDLELELFNDTSETNDAPEDFINRWFSSLWTLQEICLRPDMRLCNKNWEVLAVGKNGAMPIAMDDLIALAEGGHFQTNAWDSIAETSPPSAEAQPPRGRRIDARSNDSYVGQPKRETGDGGSPTESSEYPLAFVREAASKLGADFYASNLAEGELLEMLVLSLKPAGIRREGTASMLPFTSSLLSRAPSSAEGFTGPDHPTISSWTILPDRSVEIHRAGLISYTGQSRARDRGLSAALVAPDLEKPVSLTVKAMTRVDLDTWIDSFLPSSRNYAVCLHHGLGVIDGVLLKELASGELIKVGTYHITKIDAYKYVEPKTYSVNWRVL